MMESVYDGLRMRRLADRQGEALLYQLPPRAIRDELRTAPPGSVTLPDG